MTDQLFTVAEVMELLHCGRSTILARIASGAIKASKPGRRWVISDTAIADYLAATSNTAPATGRRRRNRAS